jgi:hypothetical protein
LDRTDKVVLFGLSQFTLHMGFRVHLGQDWVHHLSLPSFSYDVLFTEKTVGPVLRRSVSQREHQPAQGRCLGQALPLWLARLGGLLDKAAQLGLSHQILQMGL